jgi:hypothetical protein
MMLPLYTFVLSKVLRVIAILFILFNFEDTLCHDLP